MIPLIQREVTERRRWLEDRDILDIVAIAESTPGPIAINTATFVGYQVCGTLGAFCATLGVVLPSFLVIYVVSFVLRQFSDLAVVQYAFNGIRAGVLALLLKALLSMYRQSPKGAVSYAVMAGAFVLTAFCGVDAVLVILAAMLVGWIGGKIIGSILYPDPDKQSILSKKQKFMVLGGAIAAIALTIFALTYTPAPDTGDDALPTGENVSMDGMDGMDGMEGTDGEIPEEESTDGETTDEESTEEETTGETEEESSAAASDSTGNAGTSVSVGGGVMISGGGTAIAVPMG